MKDFFGRTIDTHYIKIRSSEFTTFVFLNTCASHTRKGREITITGSADSIHGKRIN